jgi:predicted nucleic acid-binding protein
MIESLVADTSLIINLFNGHPAALDVLDNKAIWTSGIVEIETLASSKLSLKERALVKDFFSKIYVVDLIKPIKELAIEVRIEKQFKISDAIILATAMYLNMPLYTYDKDFIKMKSKTNIVLVDF